MTQAISSFQPWYQRGMAVVGALLIVVVASITASRLIERQGSMTQTLTVENNRQQAVWLLRGGLDWARAILEWDAQQNAITRGNAPWSQPIDTLNIPLPDDSRKASFSGHIEDAQARMNLNNLAKDGLIQPQERDALARLLALLGLPAALADTIAQRIAMGQPSAGQAASLIALQRVDDLINLPDMKPETLARLRPYLAVLPEKTRVNPNTASAEVLSALYKGLSLTQAREQISQRDKGVWFNSPADFLNQVRIAQTAGVPRDALVTRSDWFRVVGALRLDPVVVRMEALIHRSSQGSSTIHRIQELR